MYAVFVEKQINSRYPDDEAERFTEVIEFETEEKLKEWTLKNTNIRKFRVFELKELNVNINVEIK